MTTIEYENDLEKIRITRCPRIGPTGEHLNDILVDFFFVDSVEPFTSDEFEQGSETRDKLEQIEAAIIGYFT